MARRIGCKLMIFLDISPWKALVAGTLMLPLLPCLAQAEPSMYAMVQAANLNARDTPGTAGDIVSVFPNGMELEVLQQSGPWFRVKASTIGEAVEGWVHGNHIRLIEAPAPAEVPAANLQPEPQIQEPVSSKVDLHPANHISHSDELSREEAYKKTSPEKNPLRFEATGFDCRESATREGYDTCVVRAEVEVSLPPEILPYAADEVEVTCESLVEYIALNHEYATKNITFETVSIPLVSTSNSTVMRLEHSLYALIDPATSVRLMEISCDPEY